MALIEKINATLIKLGVNAQVVELAKAPTGKTTTESGTTSGSTSGATSGVTSAAPGVVVSEIIPQTIKISYSAIGAPVIATDADGKEEPVMDGQYVLTTNKIITIAGGKLTKEEDVTPETMSGDTGMESGMTAMSLSELKLAVEELDMACKKKKLSADEETQMACKKKKLLQQIEAQTKLEDEAREVELKKYPWDKCISDNEAKYGKDGAAKICGSIKAKGTAMTADIEEFIQLGMSLEKQRLADIIDMSKNGSYNLNIEVQDGAITYGTLQTNTWQNLMLEKETEIETKVTELTSAYEAKLEAQNKVIEALKTGEVKPTEKSTPVASDVKLSKSDYIKLDIQEKINNKKI